MDILGKKVRIRAVREEDLKLRFEWANDPEIRHLVGGWHFPSSMEHEKKWFAALRDDALNQRFAIDAPDLGLIGFVDLVEIDWKNNHAVTGLMLGDKNIRGKGYGVDTFMAIARYAFDELHLERLGGPLIEYNVVALNMITKKCGWKVEGRERNWYFRKGRYWDSLVMGITRDDYHALVAQNKYWESA